MYSLKGVCWPDEIAEEAERQLVRNNPSTACAGKSSFMEHRDNGISECYSPLQPICSSCVSTPAGAEPQGLGKTYFWSSRRNRMILFEEEKAEREAFRQMDEARQAIEAATRSVRAVRLPRRYSNN